METSIYDRRKELKKKSHATMKRHYLILVFMMMLMTLFGTEFNTVMSGWGETPLRILEVGESDQEPGNVLSDNNILLPNEIISDIASGRIMSGNSKAQELARAVIEKYSDSESLGMTNGVLAQITNSFLSGRLFAQLGKTLYTITRSERVAGMIFTAGAFVFYALVFFFIKNVFSAVIRRVYLTARTYKNISAADVSYFFIVRKFLSACLTMIVHYLYYTLWCLTIVGGIIKYYSYWAVPYIVAENPSVKPREAITLSRKMMNGHKMELVLFQLSFIGWHLLGSLTVGISDMFYGSAYRLAAYTEFYAAIREEILKKDPELKKTLNDPYLFRQADRIPLYEAYFDVVEEITDVYEKKVMPDGWRRRAAEWFGIWIGSFEKKKAYDQQEERNLAILHDKLCMQGDAYPQRLSPLIDKKKEVRKGQFSYIRYYTVWVLILLFIGFCFIGWSWEVALHFMQTGEFANRGTLHGPWLPIYGSGGIVVMTLCSRFRKNPVAEFFSAIVLCGFLEYTSGWYLEMKYHQRWWSYDGYFLNLHGRICAEGLLVFGVGCCAVVYLIAPVFDHLISRVRQRILIVICAVLGAFYLTDVVYSGSHPNMAEGAIEVSAEDAAQPEYPLHS